MTKINVMSLCADVGKAYSQRQNKSFVLNHYEISLCDLCNEINEIARRLCAWWELQEDFVQPSDLVNHRTQVVESLKELEQGTEVCAEKMQLIRIINTLRRMKND